MSNPSDTPPTASPWPAGTGAVTALVLRDLLVALQDSDPTGWVQPMVHLSWHDLFCRYSALLAVVAEMNTADLIRIPESTIDALRSAFEDRAVTQMMGDKP